MADSLGLASGVVRLVEYDARWPVLFTAEQQRIHDHREAYMNAKSSHVQAILRLVADDLSPTR